MNPERFDFLETAMYDEVHENFEDLIEDKIFKYKYRQYSDSGDLYGKRMTRVIERFEERLAERDESIDQDLIQLYKEDERASSFAQLVVDDSKYDGHAHLGTNKIREYMVNEGLQQYRDYYEDDEEEQKVFEYLDNLDNRSRVRFMEIFTDYSISPLGNKGVAMIPKREFNPELSAVGNMLLDLADFRDRVRPMARDMALMDVANKYQRVTMDDDEMARRDAMADDGLEYLDIEEEIKEYWEKKYEKAYPAAIESESELSAASDRLEEDEQVAAAEEEEPVAEIENEVSEEKSEKKWRYGKKGDKKSDE